MFHNIFVVGILVLLRLLQLESLYFEASLKTPVVAVGNCEKRHSLGYLTTMHPLVPERHVLILGPAEDCRGLIFPATVSSKRS